jgi:hypothetical protein
VPAREPPALILVAPSAGDVLPVPSVAPVGVVVPIDTPVELLLELAGEFREAGLADEPDVTGVTPVGVTVIVLPVPVVLSELLIPVVAGDAGAASEGKGLVGELKYGATPNPGAFSFEIVFEFEIVLGVCRRATSFSRASRSIRITVRGSIEERSQTHPAATSNTIDITIGFLISFLSPFNLPLGNGCCNGGSCGGMTSDDKGMTNERMTNDKRSPNS